VYSYIPYLLRICIKDYIGIKNKIYDNSVHLTASMDWVKKAHNKDGGISSGYSLNPRDGVGWRSSYPEISGYFIPTIFDCYKETISEIFYQKAVEVADWLTSLQMKSGGFQGHPIGSPEKEMVFDTGQILGGLTRAYRETNDSKYLEAAERAAQFLIFIMEKDGSWIKYSLNSLPHTYHTRVAWKIATLSQVTDNETYLEAAVRNIEWALSKQQNNGWFENSSFDLVTDPLLHTIAYTIRGILEVGLIDDNKEYVNLARKSADGLLNLYNERKFLAGTFDSSWNSKSRWTCIVGDSQISIIWLKLYEIFKDKKYLESAESINNFVKSTQSTNSSNPGIKGGIKGAYPFYGRYEPYAFPAWAVKFFIDSLILENSITS